LRADRGIHDALAACRELPGRRALPAAPGGGALAAMAASARLRPAAHAAGRAGGRGARRRRRRLRWRLAFLTAALLALVAAPPAVHAEEVFTSQAAAANATDSTWIPAPAQRAALCIVDTGNDPNPDTANVIARLSVDGADGSDRSPDHHGTLMSMIASAPYNGFGMVGAAPSINVVSVRASRDGVSFGGTDLAAGIQLCLTYRNTYNIKAISLSLGGSAVSGLDAGLMTLTEDMVKNARRAGVDVVAAAGNHRGAVDWPAAFGPVLAVGAADGEGQRCVFAADGPEVDIWTSGCPIDATLPNGDAAWASGSSESTAFAAGVVTQLRQLRPDLTVEEAERAFTGTARGAMAGGYLDAGAAFMAAGLSEKLADGRAAAPGLTPSAHTIVPLPSVPASRGTGSQVPSEPEVPLPTAAPGVVVPVRGPLRLPRPAVVSVRVRSRALSLRFANRPAGVEARVQIYVRGRDHAFPRLLRTVRVVSDRVRTRILGTVNQLSITYRDPSMVRNTSAMVSLRLGK